jgi:hypothetical protein
MAEDRAAEFARVKGFSGLSLIVITRFMRVIHLFERKMG